MGDNNRRPNYSSRPSTRGGRRTGRGQYEASYGAPPPLSGAPVGPAPSPTPAPTGYGPNPWFDKATLDRLTPEAERNALIARAQDDPMAALDVYGPNYQTALDDQGMLKSQFSVGAADPLTRRMLDVDQLAADRQALDAMRERATAVGDSPWASLQLQQQAAELQQAQDRFGSMSRGQTTQAMGDLAMRGGLSSGARERMARQGARDMRAGISDLSAQGADRRLQTRIADEGQKMSMLGQTAGLDIRHADQRAGLEKYNLTAERNADIFDREMQRQAQIANQRAGLQGLRQDNIFEQDVANQRMRAAANNQLSRVLAGYGQGDPRTPGTLDRVFGGSADTIRGFGVPGMGSISMGTVDDEFEKFRRRF